MADRPLSLSVVTVTYNSARVIGGTIDAVRQLLPEAELVVVDNGSRDATVDIVAARGVDRVISGHGNVGYGGGVNRGARIARGALLLVINPDVTLVGVDRCELHALSAQRTVGIRRCRFVGRGHGDGPLDQRWSPRAEVNWGLLNWFLVPREVNVRRPRLWRGAAPAWVYGAAFVVSREEFLAIGGFDERLFLYFEDYELSRRYESHDLPVATTGGVTVAHTAHTSSPGDADLLISWALLSLIQYADSWEGSAVAERVASSALRGLAAVSLVGRLLRPVPWLGVRSAQKAVSADAVRRNLADSESPELPPYAYGDARRVLAAIEGRLARTASAPKGGD
jgi:N-acetylglucosaminyl-diphospho-decaprenol L-rhamnosyltransferase